MDTIFLFNPASNSLQIKDSVTGRLIKVKSITTCLMYAVEFLNGEVELNKSSIYHVLLTLNDYVEGIDILYSQLTRVSLNII